MSRVPRAPPRPPVAPVAKAKLVDVGVASSSKPELGFIPELLGLRGVLAIIVLTIHIGGAFWFWGWGCMEVFFALSGFLIGRQILLFVQQPGFWKKYLIRRSLRIWPLYYTWFLITVGANCFWDYFKHSDPFYKLSWAQVIFPIFYIQNTPAYFGASFADVPYHFGHSWSLAIEEQFYLLAPLIVMATCAVQAPLRKWIFVIIGLILVSMVFRIDHSYWLLVSRLDGFCAGLFLAVLWIRTKGRQSGNKRERYIFWAVLTYAVVDIVAYVLHGWFVGFPDGNLGRVFDYDDPVRLFLLNPYLGFALLGSCIIYRSAFYDEPSRVLWLLRTRLFQYLGLLSYSIYLSQVILVRDIVRRMTGSVESGEAHLADYVLSAIVVIPVAHLTYRFIELRFLKFKERKVFAYSGQS